jgi:hypothetical protein
MGSTPGFQDPLGPSWGQITEWANVIHSISLGDELPDDQQEKSGIDKFRA